MKPSAVVVKVVSPPGSVRMAQMTAGAAGFDLAANRPYILAPGECRAVSTGVRLQIPPGYEGQIRARSSLADAGIIVPNAPGTIDSDYRGEIRVLLYNISATHHVVSVGDRIAQIVFAPIVIPTLIEVEALDETERGSGGFGSTGR